MKISIIVPNFNHGSYIIKNINSILEQTYRDWELIIVDDHSTDNSRDIIKEIQKTDNRIYVIFSKKNMGVNYSLNSGILISNGELIYASAADDFVSDKDFFQKAVHILKSTNLGGFFGKTALFSQNNYSPINIIGKSAQSELIPGIAKQEIFRRNLSIPSTSFIWQKKAGKYFHYFNQSYGPYADYILNYQIAEKFGVYYKNEIYGMMRYEEKSYGNIVGKEDFLNGNLNLLHELSLIRGLTTKEKKLAKEWISRLVNSRYNYKYEDKIIYFIKFMFYFIKTKKIHSIDENIRDNLNNLIYSTSNTRNNHLLWVKKFNEILYK